MKLTRIFKSPILGKKLRAEFMTDTGKTHYTDFGASDYDDYTIHHDKERRERYRIRHKKDLRTNNPLAAGYLSYYILWGDSTDINKNIRRYKQLFNL